MNLYPCLLMDNTRCAHYIEASDTKEAAENFISEVITVLTEAAVFFVHVTGSNGGVDIWRVQCIDTTDGQKSYYTRKAIIT